MEKIDLRRFSPRDYDNRALAQEEMLRLFDLCDAVWVHDGDPKKPHAELTSGMCSDGFFDCWRVLCYPNLSEIFARQLTRRLRENGVEEVDWVVGSSYAAITFSYEVARAFGAIHGFVEKDPADPTKGKKMVWQRVKIPAGAKVLQVEELITTSGTMMEVRRAIKEGNEEEINFLPIIGTLVHRPPKLPVDYGDRKVVALIERAIWAVNPDKCPLCEAGSLRYRPKTNWAKLTGKG